MARATLGKLPTRRGRILILGLLFSAACGGRAKKADTDAGIEGGAPGTPNSDTGAAGAPADTTISVGDLDNPPAGLGSAPTNTPSFLWGSADGGFHIGNWFVVGPDGIVHDAGIDAIDPPRGDSTEACHAYGFEFPDAIDLYAQLDHPSGRPVDLSAYSGLSFWARLSPPSDKLVVALNVEGRALLREDSVSGLVSGSFPATADWQRFELPFTDAARTSSVVSIDFVVFSGGAPVDLWVDELSLVCRGDCE